MVFLKINEKNHCDRYTFIVIHQKGKKKLKTIIGSSSLSGYLGLWTHHAAQYFKGAKKDKKGEEIQMGTNTDFIAAIRGILTSSYHRRYSKGI